MTAATTSNQSHHDPDPSDQTERPGTVPWDLLSASDYRSAIIDLGSWLDWLLPTYRIPPSVVPPCWFLHAGLIEELGHLWTGWRVTRHPELGVGMLGLEWDGHRERAIGRLRELVATAGCNGTNHSPKPGPVLNRDDGLWEANLETEAEIRTRRSTERAIMSAAGEALRRAEQRTELALKVLSDIAADPGHPTDEETSQSAAALEMITRMAAADAQRRCQETRMHLDNAARDGLLSVELAAARDSLLVGIAADYTPAELADATARWLAAAAVAAPIEEALRLAAAGISGRSAAANRPASAAFRNDGVAALLNADACILRGSDSSTSDGHQT